MALGLLLVSTRLLAAQEAAAPARRGFWIGAGAGWGSANFSCSACSNRLGGVVAYVNAGATLSPRALLGGELSGWINAENGLQQRLTFLTIVGVLYPQVKGGLFLKGGIGATWFVGESGIDDLTATAPAFVLGTGYELNIGSGWLVVPFFNFYVTTNATFEIDGATPSDGGFHFNLFQIGAGFKRP